jgi:hypothetical protein
LLFSNCYCFIIVLVIVNSLLLFSGELLERHVSLSLSLFVYVSYKITHKERTKERERE